jgi:hypothetical protein
MVLTLCTTSTATAVPENTPVEIVNYGTDQKLIPSYYGRDSTNGYIVWAISMPETSGGTKWELEGAGNNSYRIRNKDAGTCLKVGGPDGWGHSLVVQWACRDDLDLKWQLDQRGNGYLITSRSNQKAIKPWANDGNR